MNKINWKSTALSLIMAGGLTSGMWLLSIYEVDIFWITVKILAGLTIVSWSNSLSNYFTK